jgi:DNA-binding transcriptional ArsR family regulator
MTTGDFFRALADPTRRAVFERLAQGEQTVSALKAGFDVSQPAISQHLATLRAAGLVRERRQGRCAYYAIDPAGLDGLATWLDRYRTFWPSRIERLKTTLQEMDDEG